METFLDIYASICLIISVVGVFTFLTRVFEEDSVFIVKKDSYYDIEMFNIVIVGIIDSTILIDFVGLILLLIYKT